MSQIVFVGTGSAIDPDLPNTSVLYRGRTNLLLDCGYGVPHALWRHNRDPELLDAVWISHRHADHSFGLPGLLLWMRMRGRTRPLTILGDEGSAQWLRTLIELGYPGAWAAGKCFPIAFQELSEGAEVEVARLRLRAQSSHHGERNLALRVETGGHSFCYSGDGAPTEACLELYRGADLVIHECYGAREAPEGHAAAVDLLEMAEALELRSLCLVHMGQTERRAIHGLVSAWRGKTSLMTPVPGDLVQLDG